MDDDAFHITESSGIVGRIWARTRAAVSNSFYLSTWESPAIYGFFEVFVADQTGWGPTGEESREEENAK